MPTKLAIHQFVWCARCHVEKSLAGKEMYTFSRIVILYKYSPHFTRVQKNVLDFSIRYLETGVASRLSIGCVALKHRIGLFHVLPFKASCLALSCKLIDVVKVKPKHMYLFTTSSSFPSIDHCSYVPPKEAALSENYNLRFLSIYLQPKLHT